MAEKVEGMYVKRDLKVSLRHDITNEKCDGAVSQLELNNSKANSKLLAEVQYVIGPLT